MFFSENLPGINPVVTKYKIRHNKNRPVRYSLAQPDRFFRYYFWWQQNRKTEACSVCELSRALVSHGQLVNYSYLLNSGYLRTRSQTLYSQLSCKQKISDLADVFSQTTSMKVICESFLLWAIPIIQPHAWLWQ